MAMPFRGTLRKPSADEVERLAQLCAELGRTVAAATDACALAWDAGDRPRIVAAAGNVEAILGSSAADLVGKPAGSLFGGGERTARDLAQACASGPICEERM